MVKKFPLRICIIGMPGSGKSTIGRILSEKLDYEFFDTDDGCIILLCELLFVSG